MANYSDNEHKFVAVLNKKTELPKLLNALAHIASGLAFKLRDLQKDSCIIYYDKDRTIHPAISKYPYIILRADNSNQIRTLRHSAIQMQIPYNDFVDSMIGNSAQDQLLNTSLKAETELEYYALVLYGPCEQVESLTRKFSLFR